MPLARLWSASRLGLSDAINTFKKEFAQHWTRDDDVSKGNDAYRRLIHEALDKQIPSEVYISDVERYSGAYMDGVKLLLRTAERQILIFIDALDRRLADGTRPYSSPDLIGIIARFLSGGGGRKVTVIVRYATAAELLKEQPLFRDLSKMSGFELRWATNKKVRKCRTRCVIVDRKSYSFRAKSAAWVTFNGHDTARRLSLHIEQVARLPDTYVFDSASVQ